MDTKGYNDRYTKQVNFDNTTYTLKSTNGCFYDVYVNGHFISGSYTSYNNAYAEVVNGGIRDWFLNPDLKEDNN